METLCPFTVAPHPSPPAPGDHRSTSCLYGFACSGHFPEWNHSTCCLLCLASPPARHIAKLAPRCGSGSGALLSTLQPPSLCGWTTLCSPARQLMLLTLFNMHKRTAPLAVSIHRSCFCLSENFSLGHCWAGGGRRGAGGTGPAPGPAARPVLPRPLPRWHLLLR